MTTILDTMISILRDRFKINAPLNGASNINDLGIDSLDIINFLYAVEEACGVSIPDEAIAAEKLETLDDFARYVDARR